MPTFCFTPGDVGLPRAVVALMARGVEAIVGAEYCSLKGGCSIFVGAPIGPQIDFFDEATHTTRCRHLARFLKYQHPTVDELFVRGSCEVQKRPVDDDDDENESFPVPDIISNGPGPGGQVFYEIKPNNTKGRSDGRVKLAKFQSLVDFLRLTSPDIKYVKGTAYSPDRSITFWDATWSGYPVKLRFHYKRIEAGLITYAICIDVATEDLITETIAKAFIKAIILMFVLAPELIPEMIPVLQWASPLIASVGSGGVNLTQDARYTQLLLNDFRSLNHDPLVSVDGIVGVDTAAAIAEYQAILGVAESGTIQPGDSTIYALERLISRICGPPWILASWATATY